MARKKQPPPRKKLPFAAIRWLVGKEHCATPIAEVRAKIEKRCARQSWATPARVRACGAYAAHVHKQNVKLYCDVMGGRIGR